MTTEKTITANVTFHGTEHTDIPVLNPGDWFGKTWLLEIGGSFTPLYLVVEADSVTDAIDELADDDTYGHQIRIPSEDLKDYGTKTDEGWMREDGVLVTDEKEGRYLSEPYYGGNSGIPCDLDHLMIHGDDRHGFKVTYNVPGWDSPIRPEDYETAENLLPIMQATKTDLDWDAIRAELDGMEWEDSEDGFGQERRVYIGSVFGLMPSGKYYMPFACSNVCEPEAEADEHYREMMEEEASERNLWITSGDGDPCDIFVGESRDTPDDDTSETD